MADFDVGRDGHYCAVLGDDGLYCWGRNAEGQLGLGDDIDRSSPVQVVPGSSWTQVTAGDLYSCAVEGTSHYGRCWGGNGWGQLGVGDTTSRDTPTRLPVSEAYVSIDAGRQHTCGVTSGRMFCWGQGEGVGLDAATTYTSPTRVGTASNWSAVSCGNQSFTCAVKTDGSLWCWGGINGASSPTRVGSASDWVQMDAGEFSVCGIRGSGQLWCWGDNSAGQLGLGDFDFRTAPTRVGSASNWTDIAVGSEMTCGIRAGRLYCWGNGTATVSAVDSATDWSDVDVGENETCGAKTDGTLWCMAPSTALVRVCF